MKYRSKVKKVSKQTKVPKALPIRSTLNPKVEVRMSLIPNAGLGMFALEDIPKDSVIATYGGRLVDYQEARYLSPEYSVDFELGKGSKLVGDDALEDLGIYANAIHPLNKDLKQNARFCLKSKVYLQDGRGRYDILARRDIKAGEEIVVSYGAMYWQAIRDFKENPPVKPLTAVARDERAKRRAELSEVLRTSKVVK